MGDLQSLLYFRLESGTVQIVRTALSQLRGGMVLFTGER